jgi:hypothetical protein
VDSSISSPNDYIVHLSRNYVVLAKAEPGAPVRITVHALIFAPKWYFEQQPNQGFTVRLQWGTFSLGWPHSIHQADSLEAISAKDSLYGKLHLSPD